MRARITVLGLPLAALATLMSASMAGAQTPGDVGQTGDQRCRTSSDPSQERVTRYRALDLPESRLREFVDSDRSVTDWYNREHLGGAGMKKAGWALVGLGLASMAIGGALMAIFIPNWWGNDDEGAMAMLMGVIALSFLGLGGLETAIGIPLVIVGHMRMKRWIEDGELDGVPLHELERRRHQSGSGSTASVSLLPYFTRGGGRLSFTVRF